MKVHECFAFKKAIYNIYRIYTDSIGTTMLFKNNKMNLHIKCKTLKSFPKVCLSPNIVSS